MMVCISHAAILKSDHTIVHGKSHGHILQEQPFGSCKYGTTQGFLTDIGVFVGREEAYHIALQAGQIRLETMPKNRKYLMSENIWSDHGDWEYDADKGYMPKGK